MSVLHVSNCQFYLQNTYICISRGMNMLLDVGGKKCFQYPKHSLFIKNCSATLSHWHQNAYKYQCLVGWIHLVLQVLLAPAVIIPLVTMVFPVAMVSWPLLVPLVRFSLGLCSLVAVWLMRCLHVRNQLRWLPLPRFPWLVQDSQPAELIPASPVGTEAGQ